MSASGPHAGQPVERAGTPVARARAAVIMVHGRGAGPANILDLVGAIDRDGVTYVAPAALNGTWYPKSFMAPIEENEPGISSGVSVIHELIERLVDDGIPEPRIVLLGFSQGACLATTAVHRRPARYGGVVAFSGGLIGPPGSTWPAEGRFDGMPAFFGCSDIDAHVPAARVQETATLFAQMGASVTTRIYPGMGHLVNADELTFARELVARIASSGT